MKYLYLWHKYLLQQHSNLITFKKCCEFYRLHSIGLVTRGLPSVTHVPHLLERRKKELPVQARSRKQQVHRTQDTSVYCKLDRDTELVSHSPPDSYQIKPSTCLSTLEKLSLIIQRHRFCLTGRNEKILFQKKLPDQARCQCLAVLINFKN